MTNEEFAGSLDDNAEEGQLPGSLIGSLFLGV